MSEIVHLQVGQCGNNIGSRFWETISKEHGITTDGECEQTPFSDMQNVHTYYTQSHKGTYTARNVLVDLEPGNLNSVRGSSYAKLFKPENYVYGQRGAANNYAKGFYTDGAEIVDTVLDIVRKQAEECDRLQGFQMSHSLGGGTGSGLGCLLIEKLKDQYPDRILQTFSVFPSRRVSDTVVQPYNSILACAHLIEKVDQCIVLDNEAMINQCLNALKIKSPTYRNLNDLTSAAMSGVTCGFRFKGQLNASLRKLSVNLVPFPRMHFLRISLTPLIPIEGSNYRSHSIRQLIQELFHHKNSLYDGRQLNIGGRMHQWGRLRGKFLTGCVLFRGSVSEKEIFNEFKKLKDKRKSEFIEWVPDNIKTSICGVSISEQIHKSATMLSNHTLITQTLKPILEKFTLMFRKQAFLHWYTSEGMDPMQFTESQGISNQIVSDYQQAAQRHFYSGEQQWDE